MNWKRTRRNNFISNFPEFVGAVILVKQGQILVSQRVLSNKMYAGKWQIPSGKVEPDKDCLTIIKRKSRKKLI